MSEVKLNLIDSQTILTGTIHGSIVDSCIAALSAEPERIPELATALGRYIKLSDDENPFAWFHRRSDVDERPYDAGIVIIDLAARIIAAESSYCQPQSEGEVHYHDGVHGTDVSIPYRVPCDWLFVNSIDAHRWSRERHVDKRQPFFDARPVLYGPPLLEFIVDSVTLLKSELDASKISNGDDSIAIDTDPLLSSDISNPDPSLAAVSDSLLRSEISNPDPSLAVVSDSLLRSEISDPEIAQRPEATSDQDSNGDSGPNTNPDTQDDPHRALDEQLTRIHANWLTSPRADLQNRSPRDVMLEKQDFIDFDLHTRSLQWTFLSEGPPCLARESFAYRYAGFGTHEWVVYYDLVRDLLKAAVAVYCPDKDTLIRELERFKTNWLENGNDEYDGRTPAVIIDNERKRLPEAMAPEQLIIDEDCECCRMMAQDAAMGFGPGFWHLDGSHMEEEFAFSCCKTIQEWETELRRREESYLEFERQWAEREYARRNLQREWDEEQLRIACEAEDEQTLDLPIAKRSG
jgi:hypothetical protein